MDVILLQKVRNLGDLGDTVKVRPGYGRNFLMPRGIALPATAANVKVFEQRRSELLAQSKERLDRARGRAEQIQGREFVVAMRASDEGKLFGSVGPQEIATKISEEASEVDAKEVVLPDGQIRLVGEHTALLQLHAEVEFEVTVIVAQLTDMGINMPPRRADDADEAPTEGVEPQILQADDDEDADEYARDAIADQEDAAEDTDGEAAQTDAATGEDLSS